MRRLLIISRPAPPPRTELTSSLHSHTTALILTSVVASVAAAITNTQHWFHLALSPHLSRDHQLYRLVAHPLVYANSAELFLGTLVLYQTTIAVERILGTRKYAVRPHLPRRPCLARALSSDALQALLQSFLAVTAFLSVLGTFVALVAGSVVTRGRFNVIPSGPFAVTFAILCVPLSGPASPPRTSH